MERHVDVLAPVKMTDELRADLARRPQDASAEERIRLTQEAFERARERQYGDPFAAAGCRHPA